MKMRKIRALLRQARKVGLEDQGDLVQDLVGGSAIRLHVRVVLLVKGHLNGLP